MSSGAPTGSAHPQRSASLGVHGALVARRGSSAHTGLEKWCTVIIGSMSAATSASMTAS